MKRLVINGPCVAAVMSMIIMSAFACRTAPGINIPDRMPLADAELWMADALMGVGPKSKQAVAEQLQNQQLEKLPKRARDMALELFIAPDKKN